MISATIDYGNVRCNLEKMHENVYGNFAIE